MKTIPALLVLSSASSAFAISNAGLIEACKTEGVRQVVEQAAAYGCSADPRTVQVSEIDNRFYNPSKYIWFTGKAHCGAQGVQDISKMVQYYQGRCF
ncbi:MAG: hypothetical protein KF789_07190 [Bdellovibrionaceae bacterium]|nr:hypothetical protein [Pseudobdellovibrionaceae bacterium]